jgi:hypothetical protein
VRKQPVRVNSISFRARMATNAAAADSAKSGANASPAPAPDATNKTGVDGEKKVKTAKERMLPKRRNSMCFGCL